MGRNGEKELDLAISRAIIEEAICIFIPKWL